LLFLQAFAYINGKENAKKNRLLFGKYVIMTLAISEEKTHPVQQLPFGMPRETLARKF
jgi:hypothetical protein